MSSGMITSLGISSGINSNAIISSLVAMELIPITALQATAKVDNAQITTFGLIQSDFTSLADAANAMVDPTAWEAKSATSSNEAAATVTATTAASPGNFSLNVNALAQGQSVTSGPITSGSAVGAGTLTITLGTWTPADSTATPPTDASFAPTSSAEGISVKIGASDSVATIAQEINAANAGVTATAFNDGTSDRLLLSSTNTGAANGFKITAQDVNGNPLTSGSGDLSQLAFDPTQSGVANSGNYGIAASGTAVQYGQDANVTINGLTVTSASNTLSSNLPGVTINLLSTTTTGYGTTNAVNNPVTLSIAQDTSGIVSNVQAFVTAYNALYTEIQTQTAYDSSTDTSAIFQGDGTIVGLQSLLQTIEGSASTGSSAYKYLSDVGIQVQNDGTLAVDTSELTAAATNGTQLQALFTTDNKDTATDGFALKFSDFASGALAAGGLVYTEAASLQTVLATNQSQQQALQASANEMQTRLQAQYSALDSEMSTLNSLSSYVSEQITTWNKSTTS